MRPSDYTPALERAYARTNDHHRIVGERWYRRMRSITHGHAARLGITPESVGAVYAAFSINTHWGDNLRLAARTLRHKPLHRGTLGDSIRKASAAMMGAPIDVLTVNPHKHKIKNFARACSGDYSVVVVDRWAWSIATAWRHCPNRGKRPCARNGNHGCQRVPEGREYLAIAEAYRRVALRHGLEPSMLQATLWAATRGK